MKALCFSTFLGLTLRPGGQWLNSTSERRPSGRGLIARSKIGACERPHNTVRMSASDEPVEGLLGSQSPLERIRGINRIEEYGTFSDQVEQLAHMSSEDGDNQVRYCAISRLAGVQHDKLSADQATLVLDCAKRVLATDREISCQAGAADVITALKLSEGYDDLIERYRTSTDWVLKFTILAGLGEMGDARSFDFLKEVIDNDGDGESLLLTAAIGSLGELGDKRGLPIVQKFVEHEDLPLRERAKIAVDRLS